VDKSRDKGRRSQSGAGWQLAPRRATTTTVFTTCSRAPNYRWAKRARNCNSIGSPTYTHSSKAAAKRRRRLGRFERLRQCAAPLRAMAKKRQQPSTASDAPPAKVQRRAKWGRVGERPRQRGKVIPVAAIQALIPIVPGAAEQRTDAAEGGGTLQLQGVLWGAVAEGHLAIGNWVQDPDNSGTIVRLGASSRSEMVKMWASVEPFSRHQLKVLYNGHRP
jgi:hypothetical protein